MGFRQTALFLAILVFGGLADNIAFDYPELSELLFNRPAKIVYTRSVRENGETESEVMLIDASQSSPEAQYVCAGHSPRLNGDGVVIAYRVHSTLYTCPAIENCPKSKRTEISGSASSGHWWRHPESGKDHILYVKGTVLYSREVDSEGKPTSSAKKLFDCKYSEYADGGRSGDGSLIACHIEGAGVFEVSPAAGIAGLSQSSFVYYKGNLTADPYVMSGYCYATISPATVSSQPFYRSVAHLPGGHLELYVRSYDTEGKELSTNSYGIQGYKENGNVSVRLRPADYDTNYSYVENPMWSNDSRYLTATFTLRPETNRRDLFLIDLISKKVVNLIAGPNSIGNSSAWIGSEGTPSELDAVLVAEPTRGTVPLTISFDGSLSTGNISNFEWRFGDGETGTGESISHMYTMVGTFQAKLIISDGSRKDSTIVEIVVDEEPVVPARIEIRPLEPVRVTCGEEQQFEATVYDENNYEIPNCPVIWTVRGPGGSSIAESGLFHAGEGEMLCDTVLVSTGPAEQKCLVDLRPQPLEMVTILEGQTYTVGEEIQFEYRYDPLVVTRPVLDFTPNNGIDWVTIDADTAGADPGDQRITRKFTWGVPSRITIPGLNQSLSTVSSDCHLRISDYHQNVSSVFCKEAFTIAEPNTGTLSRTDKASPREPQVTVLGEWLTISVPQLHVPVRVHVTDLKGRRVFEGEVTRSLRVNLAAPEILLVEISSVEGMVLRRKLISGTVGR